MHDGSFGEQLMWVLPFGYLGIVSWGFWLVRKILAELRPLMTMLPATPTKAQRNGSASSPFCNIN